jgi:hypothetical protein
MSMHRSSILEAVATATSDFAHRVAPHRPDRVEAQIASADGMPLLCAVEAALANCLPARPVQELVWLTAGPARGVHRLRLVAYISESGTLAEADHEFMS